MSEKQEVSMAKDAIEDAIENRKISGHPNDLGLTYALRLLNTRKQEKPFLCKCRNDEAGAMTVKVVSDDFLQCPRCGGLFTRKQESLDISKVQMFFDDLIANEGLAFQVTGNSNLPTHRKDISFYIAKSFCDTFKPVKTVDIDAIIEIIKINLDFISNKDGISYKDTKHLPKALDYQLRPLLNTFKPKGDLKEELNACVYAYHAIRSYECPPSDYHLKRGHDALSKIMDKHKLY